MSSSKTSARPETSNERLRNHESCGIELIEKCLYSIHNWPAQTQFVKLSQFLIMAKIDTPIFLATICYVFSLSPKIRNAAKSHEQDRLSDLFN